MGLGILPGHQQSVCQLREGQTIDMTHAGVMVDVGKRISQVHMSK